jgi:hypothetical protein
VAELKIETEQDLNYYYSLAIPRMSCNGYFENGDIIFLFDGKSTKYLKYYNEVWLDVTQEYNNKPEETKNMKQCEFELGDLIVVKDEFENIFDGEVLIACPGYDESNLIMNKGSKGVSITALKLCDNCGELEEVEEFTFDFNGYHEVEDVTCDVYNGLLTLQVIYKMDGNVEINKSDEVNEEMINEEEIEREQ